MTVSIERTPAAVFLRLACPDGQSGGIDGLIEMLARPLPYNTRFALEAGTLVLVATLPATFDPTGERAAWLRALLKRACTRQAGDTAGSVATDDLEETVRWIAAGKGWVVRNGEGEALRLSVSGELDMPPVTVSAAPDGLLVERAVPLLPVRQSAPVVRAAFAHTLCLLNRVLVFARARLHDATALTVRVESQLAPGADEDEVEHALEGVRHGARYATTVLEPVRHRAVAEELAIALDLPEARELRQEE